MLLAWLAVLAGGLLTATLDVAGLRAGATPAELVLWGGLGVLFARTFSVGALVLALPVLLAAFELLAGGVGVSPSAGAGDPLTLALPDDRRLELTQWVFAVVYATWALRFGLRARVTWSLLFLVLFASVARDGQLPAVTLLGAALLLPNLDRLGGLLRDER